MRLLQALGIGQALIDVGCEVLQAARNGLSLLTEPHLLI